MVGETAPTQVAALRRCVVDGDKLPPSVARRVMGDILSELLAAASESGAREVICLAYEESREGEGRRGSPCQPSAMVLGEEGGGVDTPVVHPLTRALALVSSQVTLGSAPPPSLARRGRGLHVTSSIPSHFF